MKNFKLLFMLASLLGLVACSSYSDELIDEMNGAASRSVRASLYYNIEGPEFLTASADYKLVGSDGSAVPSNVTVNWDYPSDFYKIGIDGAKITLGRKMAEGTYTLSATVGNGVKVVSKSITALGCKIGGPAEITSSASFKVVDEHDNNLPYGLTVTSWECPSGMSIISQSTNSVSIQKGSVSAGSYTLKATLSNGYVLTKTIVVKSSGSDSVEKDIRLEPTEVATSLQGIYKNVNEYLMMSTGRYLVGDKFYLKCNIVNSRTSSFTLNASTFKMSYGKNSSKYTGSFKSEAFGNLSSLVVPANGRVTFYIELVGDWMNNRLPITMGSDPLVYYVTNIYFYNNTIEIDAPRYNFLFSTREEQGRN